MAEEQLTPQTPDGLWTVQAQVTHSSGGCIRSTGVPTFFLDEGVQGIVSEQHAISIAKLVIDPFGVYDSVSVSVARNGRLPG